MEISINHNGENILYTLSGDELIKAYTEQQHIYDMSDIANELGSNRDEYIEKYGIDERPVTGDEIELMALKLRYYLDYDADSTWPVCVRDAITAILEERNQLG